MIKQEILAPPECNTSDISAEDLVVGLLQRVNNGDSPLNFLEEPRRW